MDTIYQDLKEMELTWEEAQQLSVNKECRQSVAHCVFKNSNKYMQENKQK